MTHVAVHRPTRGKGLRSRAREGTQGRARYSEEVQAVTTDPEVVVVPLPHGLTATYYLRPKPTRSKPADLSPPCYSTRRRG